MIDFKDLAQLKNSASEHLDLADPIRVRDPENLKQRFLVPVVRAAIFPSDSQVRVVAG